MQQLGKQESNIDNMPDRNTCMIPFMKTNAFIT
jgi:hypothetical protein